MIDVTTQGPDGHWDYEDIARLCAYRDRLRAVIDDAAELILTFQPPPGPYAPEIAALLKASGSVKHPNGG